MPDPVLPLIRKHREALKHFEEFGIPVVHSAANMILQCYQDKGRLFICGNGGSAADSQHIAGELVGRFRLNRRPLPAFALCTDISVMTCIGNDYGYDEIFSRQVEAMIQPNDLLWAISTSGKSTNILNAVNVAKSKGCKILGFTGLPKSKLEDLSDCCLCANCDLTSTSQEIHQLAYHAICEILDQKTGDGNL